ncbi:phytoene/squalene synthase family protein [Emcibacter sp.]|uniref:phytoene/squalene synthase family protein n=1 Tax=Emcibacter sp. TaxID=1979954 RepID=UPI002AA62CAA|nr:phytoene/squalene synthase family protein [Emcibacter sp.]
MKEKIQSQGMTTQKNTFGYCAEQVRRQDHDRFLTVLFAPQELRDDLFALYAFNQELARIRETVSEPVLGEIRLQWWREAIDEIYDGAPRKHEVVDALAKAVRTHNLPREIFHQIIESRGQDIYDENPQNLGELIDYLRGTSGNIARLAAQVLADGDTDLGQKAEDSGVAWGLTGIVRAVPYHLSLRKVFLPADRMEKYGLSRDMLASPESRGPLGSVTGELCEQATILLREMRSERKDIPSRAHSLFLLNSLSRSYLKSLKKADYSPFNLQEKSDAFSRQCRLMLDAFLKRV